MEYWKNYTTHNIITETQERKRGKDITWDRTIYTLDIESSSYFVTTDGAIHGPDEYAGPEDVDRVGACLYIWQFGVNDSVYYGRTKEELVDFLHVLFDNREEKAVVWIHNLAFEFEFLQDTLKFCDVFARKKHAALRCGSQIFNNLEFRCSLTLSNSSLAGLTDNFNLSIKKAAGDLDYNKIRTPRTPLTDLELYYCEMDCLVLYEYIKHELNEYGSFYNFPMTATGKVRRELRQRIENNKDYHWTTVNATEGTTELYNILMSCYAGGYTHSNRFLSNQLLYNVVSWDFTSSYPFVLISEKYPMEEFKKCPANRYKMFYKDCENDFKDNAYLMHVRFYDICSKTQNTFISVNKCIERGKRLTLDNGRLDAADYVDLWITEQDFLTIRESYGSGKRGVDPLRFDIIELFKAKKDYLPYEFVMFVLELYKQKTQYKGVAGKEGIYNLSKALLNSCYGMCVTCIVSPNITYNPDGVDIEAKWTEEQPDDEEITKIIKKNKQQGFLATAWGVYCSAYARRNLLKNVILLDAHCIYCDTDSMKLLSGFDINVINDYNNKAIEKLRVVSEHYNIPFDYMEPEDKEGIRHALGVFDFDGDYAEFKTLGAKKYCVKYSESEQNKAKKRGTIEITVAGVPKKSGGKMIKDVNDFEEGIIFKGQDTGKLTHFYCEDMEPTTLTDYLGVSYTVNDRYGVCLLPCNYKLKLSSILEEDAPSLHAGRINRR